MEGFCCLKLSLPMQNGDEEVSELAWPKLPFKWEQLEQKASASRSLFLVRSIVLFSLKSRVWAPSGRNQLFTLTISMWLSHPADLLALDE
jgi:hypothetical protein